MNEFTLEKLKIAQQLQDVQMNIALLNERVKVLTEKVDSQLSVIQFAVDRHEHLLFGDGDKGGFMVRIDRIEQTLGWIKWLWTAVILLSVQQLWKFLFKGP